jgi:hypothetical protein
MNTPTWEIVHGDERERLRVENPPAIVTKTLRKAEIAVTEIRCDDPLPGMSTSIQHVSAYAMYGFAILSTVNYRDTMQFAVKYHQLATPLTTMEFTENDGCGVWLLEPLAHPRIDARLFKFIIEMQFGTILSLHRDIMGSSFSAKEFQRTFPPTHNASEYADLFGAPVLFGQSANGLLFDSHWLEGEPRLGNEITNSTVMRLCDAQIEEFQLRKGLVARFGSCS